jgi:D-xylose transport system substrate-binding protein
VVALAHKANIKVISYDRLIKNANVDFYVTFDNEKVGQMQAQGVLNATSSGNFAYIGGAPTDNNSSLLKRGSMAVLEPYTMAHGIKLVINELMTDWKPEEAYKTIKNYLTKGGKLDGVIAANDGTASGVIMALNEFGLAGKIPVSGQDAELSACQRVVSGMQTMTVYKPIRILAEQAANIAVQVAKGNIPVSDNMTANGLIDVPSKYLEPIPVTKENMLTTVVSDGFHTKAEIYKDAK